MKSGWALATAIFMALSLVASACSSSAPTPTQAPAAPVKGAESVKPASNITTVPAKPAAITAAKTEPPAIRPAAGVDWKADWDRTLATAKQEGKVVVAGGPGDVYRNAAMAFRKSYPDIQLEYTGFGATDFVPAYVAERAAGKYLWDVYSAGALNTYSGLVPQKAADPIKPLLVLPDVLNDDKWIGGFGDGWMDSGQQYVYGFQGSLNFVAYVNRDLVPESELSSVDQLLDSRWKGKMVARDPRVPGKPKFDLQYLLHWKGEDWLRKLLNQDLVILDDLRQHAESIVRGRYPIALGGDTPTMMAFNREGLGLNVKALAPDTGGSHLSSGRGNITLLNQAPHPNAAKVYINWLLGEEGQKAWVEGTEQNSRRVDVGGPDVTAPKPNISYQNLNKEEFLPLDAQATKIARELLK